MRDIFLFVISLITLSFMIRKDIMLFRTKSYYRLLFKAYEERPIRINDYAIYIVCFILSVFISHTILKTAYSLIFILAFAVPRIIVHNNLYKANNNKKFLYKGVIFYSLLLLYGAVGLIPSL